MKPFRIFASAQDPRNVVLAKWGATLVLLEWVVAPLVLAMMPMGHDGPPSMSVLLIVMTVSSVLMLMGWRGLVSNHTNRIGSFVLFATNFIVLPPF